VAAADVKRLHDTAAELKDDKTALLASLELLRVLYRDALLGALGVGSGRVIHADLADHIGELSGRGPDRLRRRIDAVAEAETWLRGNVSSQLCLERMMLRLREC